MTSRLVDKLDHIKARFEAGDAARKLGLLRRLSTAGITDAATLIRFHETLLFLLAYPQNAALTKAAAREHIEVTSNERYARSDSSVTGQILKVLAKRPDDRFQTPAEVAAVMGRFAAGSQLPTLVSRALLRSDDATHADPSDGTTATAFPRIGPREP